MTERPASFQGSCHCGRVTFEVVAAPTGLSRCNCSLCDRKGALYLRMDEIRGFTITGGDDVLSMYQFNTNKAKHYFCSICGIHVFHRPRLDPSRWSVNARCLEGFDRSALEISEFDGKHWEQAATRHRDTGSSEPQPT